MLRGRLDRPNCLSVTWVKSHTVAIARGATSSMFKRGQRRSGFRPAPERLEGRQLLAATLRGVDLDGDVWVLRLLGPGDLGVTLQPDANDDIPLLGEPSLIDTITITGTDPLLSRLVGIVRRGANGDGKVFFNTMNQLGGFSANFGGANLGTKVIDMPHFWLGQTGTGDDIVTPSINLNFGVETLRFGGVDVRFAAPGAVAPNQDNQADTFQITLGVPFTWGTSIVVDSIITDAQPGVGTQRPTQDGVTINVTGRLNVFQANSIQGNTSIPSSGFIGGGGTIVRSIPDANTGLTGQIGFARVGGNATNFHVQTNDRVSNFYIGGETSNVSLLAPDGVRHVQFGRGMDDVTLLVLTIDTLQANRGAVASNVQVANKIGRIVIGGDVVNTTVVAGYQLDLEQLFLTQIPPTDFPDAKSVGAINNVLIAGDIVDSIFAASVQPFEGEFDVPEALFFPHSRIKAKVEGRINNANVTPLKPGQAFYAKSVVFTHGPVNPPNVVEPPFKHPFAPPSGNRIAEGLQPSRPPRRVQAARANPRIGTRLAQGSTFDPADNV